MKRFFVLLIGTLLSINNSTLPIDKNGDQKHLNTFVDAIQNVMNTNGLEPLNINTLLEYCANSINECNDEGWTLLSASLYKDFIQLATQLEQRGARMDWSIIDAIKHDNDTALRPLINRVLQKQPSLGVDFKLTENGYTPLLLALEKQSHRCVALLRTFNASLEIAYSICIDQKNRTLFCDIYASVDQNESIRALRSLVYKRLFQSSAEELIEQVCLVAGNEFTHQLLEDLGNSIPELTNNQIYQQAVKMTAISMAMEQDSFKELCEALHINGFIIEPKQVLLNAFRWNARNIVSRLTSLVHKPPFINLTAVALIINQNNQQLVADYITCYMKKHGIAESVTTIKKLYLTAKENNLPKIEQKCREILMEKVLSLTLKTDNLELLKTILAELEAEQIYLGPAIILTCAIDENACAITAWLYNEQGIKLDLETAIELIHARNIQCAQIYFDSYLRHLQVCPMEEYGIALFLLKNELKEKVVKLDIPSLTQWYTRTILPLLAEQTEDIETDDQTLADAQQLPMHRRNSL